MTQESKSRCLLTSPTIYSLREYLDRNTGREEEKGITHLQTCHLLSYPSHPSSIVAWSQGWSIRPGFPAQLWRRSSSAFTARPLGELLWAHPGVDSLRQFSLTAAPSQLGKHILFKENSGAPSSFSLLSSHPLHPPYHSTIKKKK